MATQEPSRPFLIDSYDRAIQVLAEFQTTSTEEAETIRRSLYLVAARLAALALMSDEVAALSPFSRGFLSGVSRSGAVA